jgi:hypothetical protein
MIRLVVSRGAPPTKPTRLLVNASRVRRNTWRSAQDDEGANCRARLIGKRWCEQSDDDGIGAN